MKINYLNNLKKTNIMSIEPLLGFQRQNKKLKYAGAGSVSNLVQDCDTNCACNCACDCNCDCR